MMAVEDDCTLTGDITDGPADPIDEDTFNDRDTSGGDDSLDIHGRTLTREREEPPRSIASELVAHVSTC
jgi:hypothetical protein